MGFVRYSRNGRNEIDTLQRHCDTVTLNYHPERLNQRQLVQIHVATWPLMATKTAKIPETKGFGSEDLVQISGRMAAEH